MQRGRQRGEWRGDRESRRARQNHHAIMHALHALRHLCGAAESRACAACALQRHFQNGTEKGTEKGTGCGGCAGIFSNHSLDDPTVYPDDVVLHTADQVCT